ncbi:hypothetical protein ACHAXR_010542 [Thalassiosira sp. AJA248-18]
MPTKSLFKLAKDSQENQPAAAVGQQGVLQPTQTTNPPHRESRVRLKWDDRLEQLKAFKTKHGHVDVPRSYVKDPSLGTFVCNQRQTYKRMNEGKGPSMDRSRVQQLNELGFKWVLKHRDQPVLKDDDDGADDGAKPVANYIKPKQLDWENGMAQLKAFKLVNGHSNVPHIYAANQPLGNFVKGIRQNYKHMQKGKGAKFLNESRIHELQCMGFKLQVRQREPWEQRFQELRQHVQKHGNCEVPKHTPLGIWILNQRSQFKLMLKKKPSHMSEDRINQLNSIGFDWRIPMQNGTRATGVYVYSGNAYIPPTDSDDAAASSDASLAADEKPSSVPSDAALASALAASEYPAAIPTTFNDGTTIPHMERSSAELIQIAASAAEGSDATVPSLEEINIEMQPDYHQAAASSFANHDYAAIGNIGYPMQPNQQLFTTKPSPTVRSVTENSTSFDSSSLGVNMFVDSLLNGDAEVGGMTFVTSSESTDDEVFEI